MPVQKGPGCVGREMELFHKGQLHSGKSGKVVTDPKQAKAIALSACGESKYSEVLQSMGFPADVSEEVVAMFGEIDWGKQFKTGKRPAPENPENLHTGEVYARSPASARISKTGVKGDDGKLKVNSDSEMLSPVAYPKGPANPQGGSSKEVYGMRALG
jgi:hypothetical protein